MKTLNFVSRLTVLIFVLLGFSGLSWASPVIDSLTVQGYMKKANGTAVTDGTYNLVFGVRQNGSTIWAKQISTTITNGLFAANLSGLGTNLTALGAGTGMNSDFSAVTLNPALLQAAGSGGIVARVYANSAIDGSNPQFDITINSTPTAFIANTAQAVASGSVGLAGIATAAKTNTSAGAGDSGKIVLLNASGKIDDTMFPATLPAADGSALTNVNASSVSAGSIAVAGIAATSKASTSAGVADAGKIALLNGSGKIDDTLFPSTLPAVNGSALTNVTATSVAAGAIDVTSINATAKASTSAGAADAGKVTLLNGSGKIDDTLFPSTLPAVNGSALTNVSAASVAAGSVAVAGIAATSKASTSAGAADAGKIALLNGSGLIDSTMISGLTVAQGGTGQSSNLTQGGVVYGSSTTAMASSAAGTSGQVLTSAGTGAPTWSTISQPTRRSQIYLFEDYLSSLAAAPAISASAVVGTSLWTAGAATGTVVTTPAATAAGELGRIQVATSTTAANIFLGFCGIPSAAGTPVFNSRFEVADAWTFEIRFQVSSIGANTGFTRLGVFAAMSTTASTPATPAGSVVGSYIEQTNGAATMSAYTRNTGSSGGSIVTQSTTAASTYERWTVSYDGAGTLTFSKNGTSFTTLNTAANIPTATAVCPGIQIVPGTSARNVIIDYMSFTQSTSSR